jgi:hypothetical protein
VPTADTAGLPPAAARDEAGDVVAEVGDPFVAGDPDRAARCGRYDNRGQGVDARQ